MNLPPDTMSDSHWVLDEKVSKLIRGKSRQLSRSPGFSLSDQPDIEQDLRLHLLRKTAKFNPSRAKEITFAQRLIENKAASMVRAARAKKRTCDRTAVSLSLPIEDGEKSTVALAETIESTAGRRHTGQRLRSEAELAQLRIDVAEATHDLPFPLRQLTALLSHVPQFAAGEVLGLSRRQTAKHIATVREVCEARG